MMQRNCCNQLLLSVTIVGLILICQHHQVSQATAEEQQPAVRNPSRPWLRHLRQTANGTATPVRSNPNAGSQLQATPARTAVGLGSAIEVPATSSVVIGPSATLLATNSPQQQPAAATAAAASSAPSLNSSSSGNQIASNGQAVASNRTTRTAEIFQNGDGFNMFVTNTCERNSMKINVKTSRPFFGIIHTQGFRQKPGCSLLGTGATDYDITISQSMLQSDPDYCGAIRGARNSPEDDEKVSLVVAVRVHKKIELPDDRYFWLNCTNRCKRPDCASNNPNERIVESPDDAVAVSPPGDSSSNTGKMDECTIYKFPWAISLLWCLGILCVALMISHCVLCSSLVCRCVKREVEEVDGSVYEEDNQSEFAKKHPLRIEYDNRDYYKSNNYQPYSLSDRHQQQQSFDEESELETRSKSRNHRHSRHNRHRN